MLKETYDNNTILSNIPIGSKCIVLKLLSKDSIRRRLLDLGIIEGTEIEVLQISPSGDPVAYLIRGAVIALREEDSSNILVSSI